MSDGDLGDDRGCVSVCQKAVKVLVPGFGASPGFDSNTRNICPKR